MELVGRENGSDQPGQAREGNESDGSGPGLEGTNDTGLSFSGSPPPPSYYAPTQ